MDDGRAALFYSAAPLRAGSVMSPTPAASGAAPARRNRFARSAVIEYVHAPEGAVMTQERVLTDKGEPA